MSIPPSSQAPANRDFDEELVLTFVCHYQALERALVRAGYRRAGRTPGSFQADWGRFAYHLEGRFNPAASPVLQGAVAHLLCEPDNLELREQRLENSFFWDITSPHRDIVWLSELIQLTGTRLVHGLNFPGRPRVDLAQVSAALFVLEEWAHLDPEVESLLVWGL